MLAWAGIAPARETKDSFVHGVILLSGGQYSFVAVDWCEIRNAAYDHWRSALDGRHHAERFLERPPAVRRGGL